MIDEKKLIEERRKRRDYWESKAAEYDEAGERYEYLMDVCDGKATELTATLSIINEQPKVGEWIPFIVDGDQNLECPLPEEQEILISNGRRVWVDTLMYDYYDNGEYYFDNYDCDLIGCAWMPLPEPWEGEV